MAFDYDKYIRPGKLPHIWCPGCGHGIVMKGLIRAIDTLGLEKKNTAIVSGIGCASRLPGLYRLLYAAHRPWPRRCLCYRRQDGQARDERDPVSAATATVPPSAATTSSMPAAATST